MGQQFNVKFSPGTYEVLQALAEELDTPMSDVVREAISVLWYVLQEQKQGSRLLVKRGDDVSELVLASLERARAARQVRARNEQRDAAAGSPRAVAPA